MLENEHNKKTYWPHMILGFLSVGITLGYWTIKSASSLPVQESNKYMLSYQQADNNINKILTKKKQFDKNYTITIKHVERMLMSDNIHSHRKQPKVVKLVKGLNHFFYEIKDKSGTSMTKAKVAFLFTQPHSRKQDKFIINIPYKNGGYMINDINITQAGRYTLQLRAIVNENSVGYLSLGAYLQP